MRIDVVLKPVAPRHVGFAVKVYATGPGGADLCLSANAYLSPDLAVKFEAADVYRVSLIEGSG